MKLKQIALIVGLLSSATAFAAPVTIAEINQARSNGTLQQAWITGATAPTLSVYEGWVGSGPGVGCDVDTNTIFSTQSGSAAKPGTIGNVFAYACRRSGIVSVLYSTISGGSLSAYTPHTVGALPERIRFVGDANCATTVSYSDTTNPENNATVFKGCTLVAGTGVATANDGAPTKPVGGFSDVEAALFSADIGGGDVSSFGTESQALVGQVFGVVVSTPLYRALQTAQGLSDVNATTYDPANAPNITSAQYASIITAGGSRYQRDWSLIVGPAGVNKKVFLARRVDTSGSQASSNAFFLRSPCAAGLNAALTPATAANSTANFIVTEGSGTGNVKTTMTNASNAGEFAIGVVSAENDWRSDAAASAGYRFVKLDGVHPEAGDVANARVTATTGNYPFHMELVNFVANSAEAGFPADIIPEITAALANPAPASCATLPRGITLNPLGGSSCAVGVQEARGTNFGNNCSPAQLTQ